jgi:hypothetical protein
MAGVAAMLLDDLHCCCGWCRRCIEGGGKPGPEAADWTLIYVFWGCGLGKAYAAVYGLNTRLCRGSCSSSS